MMMSKLPEDLVKEILCRVPATYLKRVRSTCKRWNHLFKYDTRFAKDHSDKSPKEFLALLLNKDFMICQISINLNGKVPLVEYKKELRLHDDHFEISEAFHCDGLLLCNSAADKTRILVWNPLNGETRWIKAGTHVTIGIFMVLGFTQDMKKKKSYKVLSFCRVTKNAEIYEFDTDSWRILEHDIAPGLYIGYNENTSVSLNGNIYWFATDDHTKIVSLVRFDFTTEKAQHVVPLPYKCLRYETESLTVFKEEKLAVFLQPTIYSKAEVWVTDKIDDETNKLVVWSKVLILDLSTDLEISEYGSFVFDDVKKVIVWCERCFEDVFEDDTKSVDMFHIVGEDNKVISVHFGVDTHGVLLPTILNYVPSLVHIERP